VHGLKKYLAIRHSKTNKSQHGVPQILCSSNSILFFQSFSDEKKLNFSDSPAFFSGTKKSDLPPACSAKDRTG